MRNFLTFSSLLLFCILTACRGIDTPTPSYPQSTTYFPNGRWEHIAPNSLGWNIKNQNALVEFLKNTHTKSFIILVNGKIAMEEYFDGQTVDVAWEWNSAGKTLVAATIGIAQQKGFLDIHDKVSKYLGEGWSSEALAKENLITIKHLLSMTTGLNDKNEFVTKENLTYLADAGSRWSYSNVFQLLVDIVQAPTHQNFETFFNSSVRNKIGMGGYWKFGKIFTIYHSNARSMARFGLLALNQGKWKDQQIIDKNYFTECIASSQNINPSYGYLWWLNGKSSYMVPGSQKRFSGALIPNAPADLYSAMGARDQRIYVIPSKNMVVIRMGNPSNPEHPSFAVSGFDQALWEKINAMIK